MGRRKSRGKRVAYFVLERRAQAARVEVPDAHLAICRSCDDRACPGRPNGRARAISGANDTDEDDGFHALAICVTA